MAAPSIAKLCKYLESSTYDRTSSDFSGNDIERKCLVDEKGVTLSTVVSYVMRFSSSSTDNNYKFLNDTIKSLNDLTSELNGPEFRYAKPGQKFMEFQDLLYNSFVPEVQKFFEVSQLRKEGVNVTRNEVLAGFIHFLLQVLASEGDRIWNWNQYAPLQKELTFLLTFLGDVPFQLGNDDVLIKNNIWEEFGHVADEAGGFVYSCVFVTPPVEDQTFKENVRPLLKNFELLKPKIEEFCVRFVNIFHPRSCVDLKSGSTSIVDSLFNVDTLLEDVENLMDGHSGVDLYGKAKDRTDKLHKEIVSTRSFLRDIVYKARHHQDSGIDDGLKEEWLVQIRDVAYEAKYLLNSFEVGNVPMWYLTYRLQHNIIEKFEFITGAGLLKNKTTEADVSVVAKEFDKDLSLHDMATPATAVVDDVVVGIENETVKILEKLIGEWEKLRTISIYGMPGLGKTTIAKKLYNHPLVTDRFDRRVWLVVSQTYQKRKVLIEIMVSLASNSSKVRTDEILKMKDENLQLEIYKSLKGRRYLIVMDDVWSSDVWDDLRRCFPDDGNGSRIMFTSRIKDTAPTDSIIHTLPFLSKDQCWELLEKKIFSKERCPQELENIGRRIASSCNGLPLAVVVAAGILANTENEQSKWKKVEGSLHSYLSDDPSNCMKILELSYEHLPCQLKQCFLYLGMYPEDTEILTKNLKWLWIAEGFIRKDEEKSQEQVAEEYLRDLIGRSLVLSTKSRSTGGIKTCTIHDLVREMCIKRAEEENFMKLIKDHISEYQKHERLCIHSDSLSCLRPFSLHCRSLRGHLSVPTFHVSQMKLLRTITLTLDFCMIRMKRIDELVLLRYLSINTHPQNMAAILKLVNLEVLCMDTGRTTVYMPCRILEMEKLRHIHLKSSAEITQKHKFASFQSNINYNLQTLSSVRIFDSKDEEILRCLSRLEKLKCICGGKLFPDLTSLAHLESLKMTFPFSVTEDIQPGIFKFPITIKKLRLSGLGLAWEEISVIGELPCLEVLKLERDAFKGEKWETKDGGFQKLRLLKLYRILSLEQWIVASSEHFPKLEHLVLRNCRNLERIPTEIGEIPTLQMIEVNGCEEGVEVSALRIREEQREYYGNEDLQVIVISRLKANRSENGSHTESPLVLGVEDKDPYEQVQSGKWLRNVGFPFNF